ncbi:MAG: hypothetical protein AB1Z29_05275 [Desulfobacterales bacterium]
MLATQNEAIQRQQPWDYFRDNLGISNITQKEEFADFSYEPIAREFRWAEQVYQAGDTVALVAVYKNLPHHLQYNVDQLLLEEYRKKLFRIPLFEASLLLLSSGCLPGFDSLRERSKRFFSDSRADLQQQKALDFISSRNPEDIVVLVMRSGQLIGTMTLFPFSRKQDIPSLSYLRMEPSFDKVPDVPAVEVGRLAKATSDGKHDSRQGNNLMNTMAMAAAFIVTKNFVLQHGLVPAADSYMCGDTYGSFISSLKRFFPMRIVKSRINPDMLKDDNRVHATGMYFLQRHVLGSFGSADDLMSVIETIKKSNPDKAHRIRELLESDLRTNGVKTIKKFHPEKFRVQFFYFPCYHPKTLEGFKRLEQVVQRMTTAERGVRHLENYV